MNTWIYIYYSTDVDATHDHSKEKIKMRGCLNLSMPNSKIINEWKSHKTKWKTINGIRKTIQMIEIL